jgi:Tfp pilus assembly protein PilX
MMRSLQPSSRRQSGINFPPGADHHRRGTVLIICIVCVLLLSLTAGVLIRAAMLHRDQTRTLGPQSQAEWLAHAAAQVAADRLRADSAWKGETWTTSKEQTGLTEPARIAITVSTVSDRPESRIATITIDFPPDSPQRVRVVQSVEIETAAGS